MSVVCRCAADDDDDDDADKRWSVYGCCCCVDVFAVYRLQHHSDAQLRRQAMQVYPSLITNKADPNTQDRAATNILTKNRNFRDLRTSKGT